MLRRNLYRNENSINRITSVAKNPRHAERVIAESEFEGDISFRVFEGDNENLIETLKGRIDLLEKDYLGGSGSRGYGRVKIYLCNYEWYSPKDEKLPEKIKETLDSWKTNCINKG